MLIGSFSAPGQAAQPLYLNQPRVAQRIVLTQHKEGTYFHCALPIHPRLPSLSSLNQVNEFNLIAKLCAKLPLGDRTILGPGDDCAILKPSRGNQLITIDSMVEGVHFKLGWGTPEMLGAKALTVNLSDIAAMGGRPKICVVNLAIRRGLDGKFFTRLYAGLNAAARAAKVGVVGGNITQAEQLAITIALLGEGGTAIMRRDTARSGDAIYVTGTVGDAALGLRILGKKLAARGAARAYLINRLLQPTARLAAGARLTRLRPPPSAIDISDGLHQDLGHIVERSKLGAEIEAGLIPLSVAYRATVGDDPRIALTGGEDYELLFCMPQRAPDAALTGRLGVRVTRIGRIVKRRGIRIIDAERWTPPLPRTLAGWDQLHHPERQ